jgi:hypothetical protein
MSGVAQQHYASVAPPWKRLHEIDVVSQDHSLLGRFEHPGNRRMPWRIALAIRTARDNR